MKRNLILEIQTIKERGKFSNLSKHSDRLSNIERVLENVSDDEVLRYVPIALVACFQSFFRLVVSELIDAGKPFKENAIKFNQSKNVKFDFEIVTAIESDTITIGEFVSHILSWNNLNDINSNLSILINDDFLTRLKSHQRESHFESININSKNFIANSESIIKDINKVFELRHIFCHEFATDVKIEAQDAKRYFANSRVFLNHADNFISHVLFPNYPETQLEMNMHANQEFEKVEEELNLLIVKIQQSSGDDEYKRLFNKSIELWKEYRTIIAEMFSIGELGGSIYPMLYAQSLIETTEFKIERLKDELKYTFDIEEK